MSLRRRGSFMLEAAVAAVLLSFVFLAAAQMLAVTGRQRRELQWHRLATLEAANTLERIMVLPWEELNADALAALTLSPTAAHRLPQPRLRIDVEPSSGPPPGKRISVQVDWLRLAGQRGQPVVLTVWRHHPPED